jgi:hypothetical protein
VASRHLAEASLGLAPARVREVGLGEPELELADEVLGREVALPPVLLLALRIEDGEDGRPLPNRSKVFGCSFTWIFTGTKCCSTNDATRPSG